MRRTLVLPATGTLMISTDLHGNMEDLGALRAHFERALSSGEDRHWALLGDFVHGPDPASAAETPHLYGFLDRAPELVDAVAKLKASHPERVHVVLGNHDAGHVGLARTNKFHADEVQALEDRLAPPQLARLRTLFQEAWLVLVAPCGLLLAHGSPGEHVTSLAMLDGALPPGPGDSARARAVNEVLWSYGQKADVTERLLQRASAETGLRLRVVVHGHDREEAGWFVEGGNQLQPVIFGAPRENKRFLVVDLGATYDNAEALVPGLRHVHAPPVIPS